jgi:hypothetical protein
MNGVSVFFIVEHWYTVCVTEGAKVQMERIYFKNTGILWLQNRG